jgi:hypothetical protein
VGATNHIKQISSMSMLPNGPVMVSTGQRVTEWTAG